VGLDVVKGSLEEIGGRLAIDRSARGGTRITLFLPLTLSLIQALLVRCGGETFALPAAGIRRAAPAEAALEGGARELAEILGVSPAPPSARRAALEFVAPRGGVIVVDEVVGRTEIVVRPVAPALLSTGIYSGAALLDDGTIVPVLENADGALFRAGR
jgi:two-component system chemotaxis sensor kinase CheA